MTHPILNIIVGTGLATLAGCATYLNEKADLRAGGGQSQRVLAAQERLENAQAEQLSLLEERQMASEELAALQDELRVVRRSSQVRQSQIQRARANANASQSQLDQLSKKLQRQTEEFNDRALELEASRAGASQSEVAAKERELAALKQELNNTNREIDILTK